MLGYQSQPNRASLTQVELGTQVHHALATLVCTSMGR